MFTEMVTRSDAFLDMPTSTQALYFHLLSEADDDGFVSSPKMVMRIVGANADEIRTLVSKKFIIPFEGGVCVIKHWRMHNQVRKDRYIETKYKKEKLSLFIRGNGAYSTNPINAVPVPSGYFSVENIDTLLLATKWQPMDALGKGRVGQVNLGETDVSPDVPLKDNPNTVGWKQYNENDHTDDVPSVDLETGEIEKKKEKPKRQYKEIYAIFGEVLGKQPNNWLVNKTQMTCAENLYTERGLVQVEKALLFFVENKDLEFCPQITSPYDLDAKWTKLNQFMKKQNG